MHSALLKFYYRLPVFTRSTVASLRGFYLRSWRYGPETERLVAEALQREYWTADQWTAWQEQRLGFVLHRAATRVPYYRDLWAERRRRGDKSSWELLDNWQTLDKESLRRNPAAFVADDRDTRRMFHLATSGTTGKPLTLWHSREVMQAWYALFEARWRRWNGVTRYDRWAILGGQLITPAQQRRPPFWVWNAPLNQLYMSTYHLAPDLLPHYLDALQRYRIKYLWGYTSSLYELAQAALRSKRRDLKMAVVLTNGEPVLDHQRQAIADAFQCPVRETYGMSEMVAGASECEKGQLHLWPEVAKIETLSEERIFTKRFSGDLISTGLLNADMPLIRYRVGDQITLPNMESGVCLCGRTLPLLDSVEGRVDDVLYTVDNRRIGRLDPVFKSNLPIREAQIVQEALDRVRVRYVPTSEFTLSSGRSLTERLKQRLGDVQVILEPVNKVPRGANGKFRAVICNLPSELKAPSHHPVQ